MWSLIIPYAFVFLFFLFASYNDVGTNFQLCAEKQLLANIMYIPLI